MSYKIELIDKKLSVLSFDLDKVKSVIYNTFEVGNVYSKSNIKSILAKLYKDIGYKATAKANDLDNFFKTKRATLAEGDKRVEGFRLLSKIGNDNDKIN